MPVSINYNARTPLTPAELSTFVLVTLQAGSQTLTQNISIANLVASGNRLIVPFMLTLEPIDVGLKTLTATVNASQTFKESSYANNESSQQAHVAQGKYKIVKEVTEVKNGVTLKSFGEGPVSIAPSKLAGCNSNDFKKLEIKLFCLKDDGSNEIVKDCTVNSKLSWQHAGPHDHDDGTTAHLGTLSPHSINIPITGLTVTYTISEFAGIYSVDFAAEDPDGQPIDVSSVVVEARIQETLTQLADLLVFDIDNHPGDGFYATPLLRDRLQVMLFGSRDLDVTKIDLASLTFGQGKAKPLRTVILNDFKDKDGEVDDDIKEHIKKNNVRHLLMEFNLDHVDVRCDAERALFLNGKIGTRDLFGAVKIKHGSCLDKKNNAKEVKKKKDNDAKWKKENEEHDRERKKREH